MCVIYNSRLAFDDLAEAHDLHLERPAVFAGNLLFLSINAVEYSLKLPLCAA